MSFPRGYQTGDCINQVTLFLSFQYHVRGKGDLGGKVGVVIRGV